MELKIINDIIDSDLWKWIIVISILVAIVSNLKSIFRSNFFRKRNKRRIAKLLRKASKQDVEKFQNNNTIFLKSNILENMLPEGYHVNFGNEHEILNYDLSINLNEKLLNENNSLYLLGEGGIGKTTLLLSNNKRLQKFKISRIFSRKNPVPIFIELNSIIRNKDVQNNAKTGKFILNEIYKLIKDYVDIDDLEKEFTRNTGYPKYLVHLDGLNEVSDLKLFTDGRNISVKQEIINEIIDCLYSYKNVRFIITSRYKDEKLFSTAGVETYRLTGLNLNTVEAILEDEGINIEKIRSNIQLLELMRNPLFLNMFIGSKNRDYTLRTRGEILYNFFSHNTDEFYNEIYRLNKTQRFEMFTKDISIFILNIIVPAIHFRMEQNASFDITKIEMINLITDILNDCTNDLKKYYDDTIHIAISERNMLSKIAKILYKIHLEDELAIINFMIESIGIFVIKTNNICSSIHQSIKDYFVSLHYINTLILAVNISGSMEKNKAKEILNNVFKKLPQEDIQIMIIEILSEIKNKPHFDNTKNEMVYNVPEKSNNIDNIFRRLLKESLNIFKGDFSGEKSYSFIAIFEMLKKGRLDLSGEDLSNLDFRGCNFYGAFYGNGFLKRRDDKGKVFQGVNFSNSKLYDSNFYIGHEGSVFNVIYSPDEKKILSSSTDNTIKEWDVETGEITRTYVGHKGSVENIIYSPDGRKILSYSTDHTIKEWNVKTGDLIRTYEIYCRVMSMHYSCNADKIICLLVDGTIKVLDTITGEFDLLYLENTSNRVLRSMNSDCTKILVISNANQIEEYDFKTGKLIKRYEKEDDFVEFVLYSPDGEKILGALNNGIVKEWDVKSGKSRCCYHRHYDNVKSSISILYWNSVMYSPDGKKIISLSSDRIIEEIDIKSGTLIRTYENYEGRFLTASYSLDGKKILSSTHQGIQEWDVKNGQVIREYKSHSNKLSSVVCSQDGKRLLGAYAWNRIIKEWDIEDKKIIHVYEGHDIYINSALYSSDSSKILSSSFDRTIKEWDVESGKVLRTYRGHQRGVNSAVYSSDSSKILSSSFDGTIKEWDVESGKVLRNYIVGDDLRSAIYSPNGEKILSSTFAGIIQEWDAKSGKEVRKYSSNSRHNTPAFYSPDGENIICMAFLKGMKRWNVENGEILNPYLDDKYNFQNPIYSLDGNKILFLLNNGEIEEYDVKSGELIHIYKINNRLKISNIYNSNAESIILSYIDGSIKEMCLDNTEKKQIFVEDNSLKEFKNTPFILIGCDFSNIHKDSNLSMDTKEMIRQSGGVF